MAVIRGLSLSAEDASAEPERRGNDTVGVSDRANWMKPV